LALAGLECGSAVGVGDSAGLHRQHAFVDRFGYEAGARLAQRAHDGTEDRAPIASAASSGVMTMRSPSLWHRSRVVLSLVQKPCRAGMAEPSAGMAIGFLREGGRRL